MQGCKQLGERSGSGACRVVDIGQQRLAVGARAAARSTCPDGLGAGRRSLPALDARPDHGVSV